MIRRPPRSTPFPTRRSSDLESLERILTENIAVVLANIDRLVPAVDQVMVDDHQGGRSEEHTSELQSLAYLVCRLLLEKKKKIHIHIFNLSTKLTRSSC